MRNVLKWRTVIHPYGHVNLVAFKKCLFHGFLFPLYMNIFMEHFKICFIPFSNSEFAVFKNFSSKNARFLDVLPNGNTTYLLSLYSVKICVSIRPVKFGPAETVPAETSIPAVTYIISYSVSTIYNGSSRPTYQNQKNLRQRAARCVLFI